MTIVYRDERFLKHITGDHPEHPSRLVHIHQQLAASGLLDAVEVVNAVRAGDEDILRVHSAEYRQAIQALADQGGGRADPDTVVCPDSVDVALLAAGSCVDAVRRVMKGDDSQALCLVRPPGHHALPEKAMGFCLFNNAAVAARTAIESFDADRVLIVDWDVHHGNGTQEVFYEDERVTFFSAHRFPFYPGTGRQSETGRGRGLGTTFNLPLSYGISRDEYKAAFAAVLETAAETCRPDLVVISAGFDAHRQDPIGSLGLETEDFADLTQMVRQVAAVHAEGRLVSTLEGGYNVRRLAECVEVHLTELIREK